MNVTRKWLCGYFFKLGVWGFGGPIAIVAMIEDELVHKRKLVTPADFAESYALCKISPGPFASQMVLHLTRRLFDRKTAVIAFVLHILPAALMIATISMLLARFKGDAKILQYIEALEAPTLAVICASVIQFVRPYLKSLSQILIALACAAVTFSRPTIEPLLIIAIGAVFVLIHVRARRNQAKLFEAGSAFALGITLFLTCLKSTSLVFGSGLAIVPMLEADFVHRLHWVSQSDFLTGLMVGQITPGPIIATTTYLGYLVMGAWGATIATVGTFLPAIFLSLYIMPKIWKPVSERDLAKPFLAGAMLVISGGLISSSVRLSIINLVGWREASYAAVLLAIALSKKVSHPILILGFGFLGFVFKFF